MDSSIVGRPIAELDTPALLVDLAALERNIATIADEIRRHGVNWRPHAKANKNPAIVHKQLAAGAIGVTVAKVGEAEVMAQAGIKDILIANQVVGPIKTRRLAALATQADVIVAVDSPENVFELDQAAGTIGSKPRVVVEIDSGMGRCGVQPGEPAVRLAELVAARPNLRFVGLMAWEGHTMSVEDPEERRRAIEAAVGLLVASARACREVGLPVEIVSCGGSGTFLTTAGIEGVTEVQAGGATFGDATYRQLGVPVAPALLLLVQVISRAAPDRIVVDAGRKSVDPSNMAPLPRDLDGVVAVRLSAEHGTITLDRAVEAPRVGDRLLLEIGYGDQCVHLHERLHGVRDGVVEVVWPILGRGKLQ
jgi:D-serine deaminase-like pyridoxal phosphate-dependent protein